MLGGVAGGVGGVGAGGFCATVSGPRSAIAIANTTKMRMRWPINSMLREEASDA